MVEEKVEADGEEGELAVEEPKRAVRNAVERIRRLTGGTEVAEDVEAETRLIERALEATEE